MRKYTGYEIISFGKGLSAYGFGLLEQRGYLVLPSDSEWRQWDSEQKRIWLVQISDSLISERSNDAKCSECHGKKELTTAYQQYHRRQPYSCPLCDGTGQLGHRS